MSQGSNHVADAVHRDIEVMMIRTGPPLSDRCCIYKVPRRLRKLNENAYTPKVVSIGPFHHGNPNLQNTETEKQIFLRKFIKRSGRNLDSLISYVEVLAPEVRDFYSQNFKLSKEEFVKIIVVDAAFIIELFICEKSRSYFESIWEKERLSLNSWLLRDVKLDLLLLENQLPFNVLEKIFKFARCRYIRESLLDLTLNMFGDFNLQEFRSEVARTQLHFTDLLRTFYLPPRTPRLPSEFRRRRVREVKHLYSVTKLHEAGVELKLSESRCLLDLKFSGRVLEIPRLEVDDSTEMLFRNMLALEQCHYRFKSYIADYILILDYLINKERDVDLLVRKGIVKSWLGENNDVAKLVNGLGKNMFHENLSSNYHSICKDLNALGKSSWRITMPTIKRRYCDTPWQTAASIAASLILIFTFTQTVCSLYQLNHGDRAALPL